jgi:hypothetical protein
MKVLRRKKSWRELSGRQKTCVLIFAAGDLALLAAALTDLRKRPPEQINGSKRAWAAACFVNFFGPIAYFVFGRRKQPRPSSIA